MDPVAIALRFNPQHRLAGDTPAAPEAILLIGPVYWEHTGMLSDRDLLVLEFERSWKSSTIETKKQAIRNAFGIGSSRYSAVLRRLALEPAAYAHAPELVTALYLRYPESFRRRWEVIHPGYRDIGGSS